MLFELSVALVVGFSLGVLAAYLFGIAHKRTAQTLAAQMMATTEQQRVATEQQREAQVAAVVESVKQSFGGLSLEALSKMTDQFLALASERLGAERDAGSREIESKRTLIDQRLGSLAQSMTGELERVRSVVENLERDRKQSNGEMSQRLANAGEQIIQLTTVTRSLREAMHSTKQRGQWGERMAEDVLRAAGFVDGVNYEKQTTLVDGTRPDFTFLLPKDRTLNMDVKFPLDNYLRMLEADRELEQVRYKKAFLADVRLRMREVTTRAYIDPQQGTCDYVILFIPNEGIYSFIHAEDADLLEAALRQKVVFCSPITLFAVLAVIRLAIDQFAMEKTANEILGLIGAFHKQWGLFTEQMDKVGKRIEDSSKEFETLSGVRTRQMERPLRKIEELRSERQVPLLEEVAEAAG